MLKMLADFIVPEHEPLFQVTEESRKKGERLSLKKVLRLYISVFKLNFA